MIVWDKFDIPFKALMRATTNSIFIIMLLFMPPRLFAEEQSGKSAMQCYKSALECDFVLVKGNYFRAIQAVYEHDLKKELSKFNKDDDQSKYLSNIDNYDFDVELKDNRYVIGFAPTMRQGVPDYFGGLHYVLDAKTYKILKKWKSK